MSKAAELAALIGSQTALSNRNLIINGAMQVAQRGTSTTGITSGTEYNTVDRFQFGVTNAGTYTIEQSTTTPDGFGFSTNLQEYDLLQNDFLKSLLGFNLGVEMGQLLMIGIALIVVMISHRQLSFSHIRLAKVMSISSLLFLGIFWFSYRTLLIM